jgi:hypothetical protein
MRFLSSVDVFLPGDLVDRAPGFWDRLKEVWKPVTVGKERVRNRIEAATFVYELRGALDAVGIDNARSLVVDGTTVFNDARGVDGDLPDLMLALSDHVSLFGERSQELCLSVEHEEAGLHVVLDATVTTEHGRSAPAARLEVTGNASEFDPREGEGAEEYRARVEPLVTDPTLTTTLRLQFGAFVTRLCEALRRTFPETRFEVAQEIEGATALRVPEAERLAPARGSTSTVETAAPVRNFTLTPDQRIGALLRGPPPYAVRLRRVEDLEDEVVGALRECERAGERAIPIAVVRRIEEANALIRDHNRYYPVEANLPIDTTTGRLLEMGRPWKPRSPLTIDDLRERARGRR